MYYFAYSVSVAVGIAALILYFLCKITGGKKKTTNMSGTCSAGNCGLAALHQCSKCKFAGYCSKECQKKHWRKHKNECLPCTFSVGMLGHKAFSTMCVNPNYQGDDRVLLNELDWFVTEEVESAWVFASVNTTVDFQRYGENPVPRDILDQEICRETILLTVQTRRNAPKEAPVPPKMIEIEGPVTAEGLLKAIHHFYNATYLTESDIKILKTMSALYTTLMDSMKQPFISTVCSINQSCGVSSSLTKVPGCLTLLKGAIHGTVASGAFALKELNGNLMHPYQPSNCTWALNHYSSLDCPFCLFVVVTLALN